MAGRFAFSLESLQNRKIVRNIKKYRVELLIGTALIAGIFAYAFLTVVTDNKSPMEIKPNESMIVATTTPETEAVDEKPQQNDELEEPVTEEVVDTALLTDNELPEVQDGETHGTIPPMEASETSITMAWMYPGEPACDALKNITDKQIDILKPEYFLISTDGVMELMTEEAYGCNGYSTANIAAVRGASKEQYVTISSSYALDMNKFLERDAVSREYTNQLLAFVEKEGFEGIEIDFEDYGGWTAEMYVSYKDFIKQLGDKLHKSGKKLMVDVPAVTNDVEEAWYVLRLRDFESLPIDSVVVMAYDYQYDHGVGEPVAPLEWVKNVVAFTLLRYRDTEKVTMGIPAYGYKGRGGDITILTHDQIRVLPGYDTAKRDPASGEMMWKTGKYHYVYQDEESLRLKRDAINAAGINSVSVWHLGGNSWFQ